MCFFRKKKVHEFEIRIFNKDNELLDFLNMSQRNMNLYNVHIKLLTQMLVQEYGSQVSIYKYTYSKAGELLEAELLYSYNDKKGIIA